MLKDSAVYAVRSNLDYILKELKTLDLAPDVREKVELVCSAFTESALNILKAIKEL